MIIKTYKQQLNEYISTIIDDYDGKYALTSEDIAKIFKEKYDFDIKGYNIRHNIDKSNSNKLKKLNSNKPNRASSNGDTKDIVIDIVNELIDNKDKLSGKITLQYIANLLELKKNRKYNKDGIHKHIPLHLRKKIKAINKTFNLTTHRKRDINTLTGDIEIFDDMKAYKNRIVELTLSSKLYQIKEKGLVNTLNTILPKEYSDKYAIIYYITK